MRVKTVKYDWTNKNYFNPRFNLMFVFLRLFKMSNVNNFAVGYCQPIILKTVTEDESNSEICKLNL